MCGKIRKITILIIVIFVLSLITSNFTAIAVDNIDPNCLQPSENQYFELKAVQVKEVRRGNSFARR